MTELTFRHSGGPLPGHGRIEDWWHSIDRLALGALVLLYATGMVLALAASPPLAEKNGFGTYHYVLRHAIFAGLSIFVLLAASMQTPRVVRRVGVVLFLAMLLATILLPWLGTDYGKGAMRWYSLRVVSLQPSEFLKPGFVIFSAWLMAGSFARNGPPGRLLSFAVLGLCAFLLAAQPDYGQAALIVGAWTVMLFVSGASGLLIAGIAGLVAILGTVAYNASEHVQKRIDGYWADQVDPHTQLAYAQAAIREGGLFGTGPAQGTVKWTLPDAHTDFIIAVAAEEFGLILTLAVILLYLFLVLRSLMRLSELADPFIRLAGTGLVTLLGLQAFINIGVAIRLLPAKGMTLPFLSYGGSSIIAAALTMGALLALTRARPHDAAASLRRSL